MINNVFIPSIEASTLEKYGKATFLNFDGVMPPSLDMLKIEELARKHGRPFQTRNGITQTDVLLNLTFDKALFEYDEETKDYKIRENNYGQIQVKQSDAKQKKKGIKDLRSDTYSNIIQIGDMEYQEYKRSSAKAKQGSHLFVWTKIYDEINENTWKDIKFENNELVDITSLKAYESLSASEIVSTIEIQPEQILLVPDIKDHKFVTNAAIVDYQDDELAVNFDPNYETSNNVFDGEALLDSSLFNGESKGMKLLRHHFFKSCAFNTNIQQYYQDKGISTVTDMFGTAHDAKSIRLITTPSSIKFFKFSEKIGSKQEAYEKWLSMISDSPFGVVKSEHPSSYGNGNYNDLTYQMINSLPLSREDIRTLLSADIKYMTDLRENTDVLLDYIGKRQGASDDFIKTMLNYSTRFERTDLFKDYRKELLNKYKQRIYTGAVKVEGDYYTLCSMPYELLEWSTGKYPEPLLGEYEVYNSTIKDGDEIVLARNPHITCSNYVVATNVYREEFSKYFNFKNEFGKSNIIIINPWECDILERLGGADMDSDVALCIKNKLILERAKQVQHLPVPHNNIKPSGSAKKPYSVNSLVEVDSQLSQNKIGDIVNLSQILNSYYWQEYFKEDADAQYLELVYSYILALSVLSTIEIDRAKHPFDIPMQKIFTEIRNAEYKGEKIIKTQGVESRICPPATVLKEMYDLQVAKDYAGAQKLFEESTDTKEYQRQIRPKFFEHTKYVRKNRKKIHYVFEHFDCPMDFLCEELDKLKIRSKTTKTIPIREFFKYDEISDASRKQVKEVLDIALEFATKRRELFADKMKRRDKIEFNQELETLQNTYILEISKRQIRVATMESILNRIYSPDNKEWECYHKERRAMTSILFLSKRKVFEQVIKVEADIVRGDLIEDKNGTVEIWGTLYRKEKDFEKKVD